jgi:hypothetical protein
LWVTIVSVDRSVSGGSVQSWCVSSDLCSLGVISGTVSDGLWWLSFLVQPWRAFRQFFFRRSVVAIVSGESGFIFSYSLLLCFIMSSNDSFGCVLLEKITLLGNSSFAYLLQEKNCGFSDPAPTKPKELAHWKVKDARVMSWILGFVDPLLCSI